MRESGLSEDDVAAYAFDYLYGISREFHYHSLTFQLLTQKE